MNGKRWQQRVLLAPVGRRLDVICPTDDRQQRCAAGTSSASALESADYSQQRADCSQAGRGRIRARSAPIHVTVPVEEQVFKPAQSENGRYGIPSRPRGPADVSPRIDPSSLPVPVPV